MLDLVQAPRHDVVLADGSTATVHIATPADIPALADLHKQVSRESIRLRYFGYQAEVPEAALERVTQTEDPDHLALVAECSGVLLAVAQYDRIPGSDGAEVAFLVHDAHQGLGLGTLLLEILAHEARVRGVRRFAADMLAENHRMAKVFRDAGFERSTYSGEGVNRVVMDIAPTPSALAALYERDRKASARSIGRLLRPRSVAVIGASRSAGTVGHELVRNLVRGGFQGPVYPVNPSAAHIASVPCYARIESVPGPVDLAVVAVPASAVLATVHACGRKGAAGLVIVSSHFAEDSADGAALQREIVLAAHQYGMRVVGPNCFGVLNTDPEISLNATFAEEVPARGSLGFASQSGGLGIAVLAEASRRHIGLTNFVSMGNKADVSGNDLLAWWSEDEATKVGLLYLESFGNPRRFARLARRLSRSKPLIAVKSGRSAVGRRAASSHTAAMASSDQAVAALFRQTGVVRVDTVEELFDVAQILESQPVAQGTRVAVLSNVGGPGVLAVDACVANGMQVPEFSTGLQEQVAALCPRHGGASNPIDLGAEASATMYRQVLDLLVSSSEVDAVIVHFTPPLVGRTTRDVALAVKAACDGAAERAAAGGPIEVKPVVVSLLGAPDDGADVLRQARFPLPSFNYPETAARALGHALRYGQWRQRPVGQVPSLSGADYLAARRLLPRDDKGSVVEGWLSGATALEVLAAMGIPVQPAVEVLSGEQAAKAAEELGRAVALKVMGPLHKSEGGGVRLGLVGPAQVASAYEDMLAHFGQEMTGALVQPMAPADGIETIVGGVQDLSFGPLVLFGLGGVNVEALGDHVTRLAPLTDLDAADMVDGLRGSALLQGYRGKAPVHRAALLDVLHRVSTLMDELGEVAELDCNPVVLTEHGAVVVDARIRARATAGQHDLQDTRYLK